MLLAESFWSDQELAQVVEQWSLDIVMQEQGERLAELLGISEGDEDADGASSEVADV